MIYIYDPTHPCGTLYKLITSAIYNRLHSAHIIFEPEKKKTSVDSRFPPTYSITTTLSTTAKSSKKEKKRSEQSDKKSHAISQLRTPEYVSTMDFPFRQQAKPISTKPVQVYPAISLMKEKKT